MKKLISTSVLLFILSLAIFSCKKNNDITAEDTQSVTDESTSEESFDDVDLIVQSAMAQQENNLRTAADTAALRCATVTLDKEAKKITVDFGATNCKGADGRFRRGKIIITYTGRYIMKGSVITTTFDNFFINDNQVKGKRTVTNNGANSDGYLNYTVVVEGGQVLFTDGTSIEWACNITRTWERMPNPMNDKYKAYGTTSGKTRAGKSYSTVVKDTEQITFKRECANQGIFVPVSGIKTITIVGKEHARIIDFGDGSCDRIASVTINGVVHKVELKR